MTRKKINKNNINVRAWDLCQLTDPNELDREEIYNIFENTVGWGQSTVDRMLVKKYRAGGTNDVILSDLENMERKWYTINQVGDWSIWNGWFTLQSLYISWAGLVLNGFVEYKIASGTIDGWQRGGPRNYKNLLWFRRTKKPYPKYLIHSKLGI